MKRAARTTSVPAYALSLHSLTTDYNHLPQPPAWRVDRFGVIGELFPSTDALGIGQVEAWATAFDNTPVIVEPVGREPGYAAVDLPGWGVVIRCVLLGKRAGVSR